MTSPLRDAESATAGVVRQRVLELAHTKMGLDLAQWSDISNDFLRAADELDTARAEIERLREHLRDATDERDNLSAIVATEIDDVAGAELDDLEERAITAESALTAAQERIAVLEGLVGQAEAIFTHCTVSDGMCCCGDNMENHADPMWCGHSPVDHGGYVADGWLSEARATLSPAVKEPK